MLNELGQISTMWVHLFKVLRVVKVIETKCRGVVARGLGESWADGVSWAQSISFAR